MDVANEKPHINQLPWEILEDIFFHLPPYGDLESVAMVCQLWRKIASSVMMRRQRLFERILRHCPSVTMSWRRVMCAGWNRPRARQCNLPAPAPRYLAAVAALGDSVYYFGGITPQFSQFNDFWRFSLAMEVWERITPEGDFPSLRAGATLIPFGSDHLILFGGFECQGSLLMQPHPLAIPVMKMHIYSIPTNTWSNLTLTHASSTSEALLTLLSYSVQLMCSNRLFIFGGRNTSGELSDECFVVSLESGTITVLPLANACRPPARFGHSTVALSDREMLLIGGDLGPNVEKTQRSDLWLLSGSSQSDVDVFDCLQWSWSQISTTEEVNGASAPSRIFADSAFKVPNTNLVIVLGGANAFVNDYLNQASVAVCDSDDEDLPVEETVEPVKEAFRVPDAHPSVRRNARANRQRRLAALDRHDPRLRQHVVHPSRYPVKTQRQWYIGPNVVGVENQLPHLNRARQLRLRKMCIYVLDVGGNVQSGGQTNNAHAREFSWLAIHPSLQNVVAAPDETHCYKAVLCRQQVCLIRGLTVTGSRHPMRFTNFREHLFPQAEGSGCVSRFNDVFIWEINRMIPYG